MSKGVEIWELSETEEESWGERDGGWPLEGIVGEEVDSFGMSRYEVRWTDWMRDSDGTNTTWMKCIEDSDGNDLVLRWRRIFGRIRGRLARDSCDMVVQDLKGVNLVDTNTILKSQAMGDKLQKRKKVGTADWEIWEEEVRGMEMDSRDTSSYSAARNLRGSTVRQTAVSSSSGISSTVPVTPSASSASLWKPSTPPLPQTKAIAGRPRTSSVSSQLPPPSSQAGPSSSSARLPPRGLPKRAQSTMSSSSIDPQTNKRRQALQKKWNKVAAKAGAESIRLINDVDDEEIPPLKQGFRYVERTYVRDDDIPKTPAGAFMTCDCDDRDCVDATLCGCQLQDEDEPRVYAYDDDGLYTFKTEGVEVIECNIYCKCSYQCPNRIAQRPRDVPIEIFKTPDRGWGVRSSKSLEKGKVIGLYTGKLIRREQAENLPKGHGELCFALDAREATDDGDHDKYTVDANFYGNWTRFLNHSCEPNTFVYDVCFDTIPSMYMPYQAFVAIRDIPAQTEFTFDYNPALAPKKKSKRKSKTKIPDGAQTCMCGTRNCRGWML